MQQREMVLGKMYNVIGDFCNVYQVAILSERQRERCIEGAGKKGDVAGYRVKTNSIAN